jgi:hypothetical protein
VGFHDERAFVLRGAPALDEYARRDGIDLVAELPSGHVTKVMLIAADPDLEPLAELVRLHVPDIRLLQSETTYLEVLPAGAGKGRALRFLAHRAGVPMHRIAAIGDNPNDIDMLISAGLGAAVGDGHPAVRTAADVVVSSCADGGVADLVDHLLAEATTPVDLAAGT